MREWLQDLRYGARMILKRPGTSAIAIIALALGIGLTTTMFSDRRRGHSARAAVSSGTSGSCMSAARDRAAAPTGDDNVPIHDLVDWRGQQKAFESLAGYYSQQADPRERLRISGAPPRSADDAEHAYGPARRDQSLAAISPRPTGDGCAAVALIGYRVWQARFKSDPNVAGTVIRLDGVQTTIVGVMPEKFGFPESHDLAAGTR